jgi:fibronectin-binding autotransporter adhesin
MQFKYLTGKRSGRVNSARITRALNKGPLFSCLAAPLAGRALRRSRIAVPYLGAAAVAAVAAQACGQALSTPSFNASNVYNITVSNPSINGGVAASTSSSDNSAAINAYISYVSSLPGGGTVLVPAGTFDSNTIDMQSNVNLELASGAVLLDATPANTFITTSGSSTSNMEISGSGIINGGATTVTGSNKLVNLQKVSTLEITGVSIENSEQEHLAVEEDNNVTINGITINDPTVLADNDGNYLANTDGIDFGGTNFTIENSFVSDGDDDIVAKTASSACANILITNDTIGAGHGISLGGGSADGLTNMTVSNITFNGTSVGLRLKAEDATGEDSGGGTLHPVVGITYSNIVMNNVADPFIIDSFYNGGNNFPTSATQTPYAIDSTTPVWMNIGFSNITVTGASNDGLYYDLATTPTNNLIGMSFNNVSVTGSSGATMWWGTNINMSGLTMNHSLSSADLSNVTNSGAENITWNNTGSTVYGTSLGDGATWDIVGNQNWNTGTSFTAYTNESNVTFNDNNNGHYNVTLNTTVAPISTTINNSSGNYTITGAGTIAGSGSLTKTGTGIATISTANAFTGGTFINGGTLQVASADALGASETLGTGNGAAPGGTTVNSTGSLDLDGQSLTEPITLNGGTLTNSSATTASVNNGVKGVGYTTLTAGIASDSTISFSSGAAAATPVFGITDASFSGFTGTYTKPTGTSNPPPQAPSVIITPSDGKGSGALAIAVLTGNSLTGINVIDPGSGYDAAPIITFVGGNGSGGAATGNANNFTLVAMQMTSPGSGYTSVPTATLNNTGGSGSVSLTPVIGSVALESTSSIGSNAGNISLALPITGGGGLIKTGSDTLTLSGVNQYSGGTTVDAGQLLIEPTGASGSALPAGSLTINGGSVKLADDVTAGSAPGSSNVNLTSLSIAPGGTLDIGNNHIIIDYGSGPDPISSIESLIASGYALGTWTGPGITSSDAAANSQSYGIGYADAADPGNPADLSSGQIELMYTLLGDANLDGKVNGADFAILAANFNQSVTNGWDQGDFNYDGSVNGADFTLLAENFNQSATQSSVASADLAALDSFAAQNGISLTTVPEPISVGLLAVIGFATLHRRRRSAR